MVAHSLGSPTLACSVGAGHIGPSRKASIATASGLPSQPAGGGRCFSVVGKAGIGCTPNSSKRSICWLKSVAPNSGLGSKSLGISTAACVVPILKEITTRKVFNAVFKTNESCLYITGPIIRLYMTVPLLRLVAFRSLYLYRFLFISLSLLLPIILGR